MSARKITQLFSLTLFLALFAVANCAQTPANLKTTYTKTEYRIPMRDGKQLFTIVYAPRDTATKYPFLMQRTPYTVAPYGAGEYKKSLGPSSLFAKEGYIFVYQDVRGKHMSEGHYEDIRPFNPNKKSKTDIDEASDTYDTIEWLLKNIPNHNGRVGMWGISYPGFYTTMGILSGHLALRAASPQAPIADWFNGDDDHHNGALFLIDCFGFNAALGFPRPTLTTSEAREFDYGTPDGYQFFLAMGSVANIQKKYYKGEVEYWNDVIKHTTYDEFWQARNVLPHLKNIKPAVLTVGGWFDAEDLYGAINTYETIEKNNPGIKNNFVMGPWCHGCWTGAGDQLGRIKFGSKTGVWYQENIELPFFNFYLKDKGTAKIAEATIFETGSNEWKKYEQWPPANVQQKLLYFHANGRLSFAAPTANSEGTDFDEYISDPSKPVPYTNEITNDRGTTYMLEDQRFAAIRPDVMVYQTEVLAENITLSGPLKANLFVSTSGTDADFIVKLIDVLPDKVPPNNKVELGGYQMLVRWEVMRGKFRNSPTNPEAFKPNEPTKVAYSLNDVAHTFLKGHRIMVQVQSSMFPLIDRNPQQFVDIYNAQDADFQKATQRIYRSGKLASHLQIPVLKP